MKKAMKKKWKVAAVVVSVLLLLGIAAGIFTYGNDGEIATDGVLTFRCLNLLCGIFLLAIAIVLHIHMKLIEKEEEE